MSIFWCRLKYFLQTLCALAIALGALGVVCTAKISRFSDIQGERVYYLQSASSQGLRKESLSLFDFPSIRGESVRFALQDGVESEGEGVVEDFVADMVKKYKATIIFKEEITGVTSYYGYTAKWADGVVINGKKINLHIAISTAENNGERLCVVGSPIIFDGY